MNTSLFPGRNRRHRRGSAVIVVLALLSILMILVTVNFASTRTLGQEIKLLEKKQQKRLHLGGPTRGTNQVTTAQFPTTELRPVQNDGPE